MTETSLVLDEVEKAQYPLLIVPFFDAMIPIKLRELTSTQVLACGNISLIETLSDVIEKARMEQQQDLKKAVEYSKTLHRIVEMSMISPTYQEMMEVIGKNKNIDNCRKVLKELKLELKKTPLGLRRNELEQEVASYEFFTNLILPEEFISVIVSYALNINKSDIKLISEDMLYDAAILATNGHNNPANHLDGNFTKFNEDDINKRSWIIYAERKKKGSKK